MQSRSLPGEASSIPLLRGFPWYGVSRIWTCLCRMSLPSLLSLRQHGGWCELLWRPVRPQDSRRPWTTSPPSPQPGCLLSPMRPSRNQLTGSLLMPSPAAHHDFPSPYNTAKTELVVRGVYGALPCWQRTLPCEDITSIMRFGRTLPSPQWLPLCTNSHLEDTTTLACCRPQARSPWVFAPTPAFLGYFVPCRVFRRCHGARAASPGPLLLTRCHIQHSTTLPTSFAKSAAPACCGDLEHVGSLTDGWMELPRTPVDACQFAGVASCCKDSGAISPAALAHACTLHGPRQCSLFFQALCWASWHFAASPHSQVAGLAAR